MKKIWILLLAAVVLITACQKKEIKGFQGTANIVFAVNSQDSVLYTFALHPERTKDTVWVPVNISGERSDKDRAFSITIVDSATTAVVGKHFDALKDQYVIPANAGSMWLPIIIYNTDPLLEQRALNLVLRLVPTADFNTEIKDVSTVRVVFSNRFEKPAWWFRTPGGPYSIVKHKLFRLAATTDEVSTKSENAPIWIYYTARLSALLTSPDTWIANNPDKGYDMKLNADSSGNKIFYEIASPNISFRYEKDPSSGEFYFIDENNGQVK
ncbi:hypothetical protein A4H97_11750 [Niastella yeongjuensis]|uniref:DUF4843 domain-containing protein n=1 Tax=Niastella yeongjuensis TaxID=354355 RepID=A0A1V9E9P8_9BACT|nr:DUF4843 domain-containing protein [Niastella yeongjuensis]OQP42826.1 hypothetical protein A4H97_11750 [Niastella yeongjuensis]SEO55706.1 protein of unknown function [Niastella yeongjuensis]